MSEFEEQLNSILSSPETMDQIMALANSISGGGASPQPEAGGTPDEPRSGPDLSQLLSMLSGPNSPFGNLDPGLVQAGVSLIQEYGRDDQEQTALLTALRPYLPEERQARLDRAVQLARTARVLQSAYQMFRSRNGGEAGHV